MTLADLTKRVAAVGFCRRRRDRRPLSRQEMALLRREAAKDKTGNLQLLLGLYYLQQWPPAKPERIAFRWFSESAKCGNIVGTHELGHMYYCREPDLTRAMALFRVAARQGYAPSQSILGGLYVTGEECRSSTKRGLTLLEQAAEQGYVPAMLALGCFYLYGEKVPQSWVLSIKWFLRAKDHGSRRADEWLRMIREINSNLPLDLEVDRQAMDFKFAAHRAMPRGPTGRRRGRR